MVEKWVFARKYWDFPPYISHWAIHCINYPPAGWFFYFLIRAICSRFVIYNAQGEMKPLLPLLLALTSWQSTLCQALPFRRLGVADGLSQVSVLAIAQDARGFIWLGTRSGLNRFDGHSFRTYQAQKADSASISGDYIFSLLKDHNGELWVGTNNGVNRYRPEMDCFQLIKATNGKRIMALHEDREGNLWIGSQDGLYRLGYKNDGKAKTEVLITPSQVLKGKDIRSIFSDNKNRLWVGTTSGLWRLQKGKQGDTLLSMGSGLPPSCHITTIAQDSLQQVWVGSYNAGLYRFDEKTAVLQPYVHQVANGNSLVNNSVRKVMTDRQGRLWIGTQEGLSIFDPNNGLFRHYTHNPDDAGSLSQNSIYDLFTDARQNIWVGTYFGGVNILYAFNTPFHRQQYTRHGPSINNNVVSGIIEDRNQVLWIGTEGGGLNWWNRKNGHFGSLVNEMADAGSLASNLVKTVATDSLGNIWVGMHRGGLSLLPAGSHRFKNFKVLPNHGFSPLDVNAVLADSRGRIWVGSASDGLFLFNPSQPSFKNYLTDSLAPFRLSGSFIRNIYEDANHQIWVITENSVYLLGSRSAQFVDVLATQKAPPAFLGTYNCVLRDNRGRIWLGSSGRGLVLAGSGPQDWEYFDKRKGLAGNVVYGILQDAGGFLWVSTDNGLSRFDMESRSVINYNVHDGLPGNEFNFLSYFKDHSGEMFFGGLNGMAYFNPSEIQFNRHANPVAITGLLVGGNRVHRGDSTGILAKDIGSLDRISLTHSQNIITLEFSALHYIKPPKTRYAYILQGLEKTWQYSHQPSVTYNNLPPGRYTFLVKAANNDGIWYNQPTRLLIVIAPPLWKTWWAYLFYTLVFSSIVFFIARFFWVRARFKRAAAMQQFKLDFFTNISHEIRTHLSLILGPVEQILLKGGANNPIQKQLLHIRANADRLMRLVSEMMDLRQSESNHLKLYIAPENILYFLQNVIAACQGAAQARNIRLSFENHLQRPELYFDSVQMEKVFFNLITNAIKFTPPGGHIQVVADEDERLVFVKIIDNGIGISPRDLEKLFTTYFQANKGQSAHVGYGIGLALAKSLVQLHKGSLTVESRPAGDGADGYTCFTVQLLKGQAHFSQQDMKAPDGTDLAVEPAPTTTVALPHDGNKENEVVLLIDDNAELRAFIRECLDGRYKLLEADNGNDGFSMAIEQIPDIIISDVMMPGLDGLELCRALKKDIRTSHIPVILLTARVNQEQQVEGMQTGADIYITKPFSMQLLEMQTANLLASRAAMRRRFAQQVTLQPRNIEITNNDEAFLNNAIDLIEKYMEDEQFGVAMLSHKLAMSQPVLYKKLKALTDLSVNDFIKSIKLKKAASLLLTKQLNVNEVAFMVGFNDRKYFSREFKKQFGTTPSEYAGQQGTETTMTSPS